MKTQLRFSLMFCFLSFLASPVFALTSSNTRWNGFYIGADGGEMWSKIQMQTSVLPGGTYFYASDASQIHNASISNPSQQNLSGGLFAGYEHQFGLIFLGGEASVNSLHINKYHSLSEAFQSLPGVQYTLSESFKANWQEAIQLKLGLAEKKWVLYLTTGTAMTDIAYRSSYSDPIGNPDSGFPGATGAGSASRMQFGWTVGGGAEYALSHFWSIQAEYLYVDFGSIKTNYGLTLDPAYPDLSATMSSSASLITQSVLVGLTYQF